MPDFRVLAHAPVTPTCCVFCGSNAGPFVESVPEKEIPGYGRVYVCAANEHGRAGCLVQAARLVGCESVEQVSRREAHYQSAQHRIVQLEAELRARDEPVIVGAGELAELRAKANGS